MIRNRPTTKAEDVILLVTSLSMLSVLFGDGWEMAWLYLVIGAAAVLGLRSSRSVRGFGFGSLLLIVLLGVALLVTRSFVDQHYMDMLYGIPGDIRPSDNRVRCAFTSIVPAMILSTYSVFALASAAIRHSDSRVAAALGAGTVAVVMAFSIHVDRSILRPFAVSQATANAVRISEEIGMDTISELERLGADVTLEGFRQFTAYRLMQLTTDDARIRTQFEERLPQSIGQYIEKVDRPGREARIRNEQVENHAR